MPLREVYKVVSVLSTRCVQYLARQGFHSIKLYNVSRVFSCTEYLQHLATKEVPSIELQRLSTVFSYRGCQQYLATSILDPYTSIVQAGWNGLVLKIFWSLYTVDPLLYFSVLCYLAVYSSIVQELFLVSG